VSLLGVPDAGRQVDRADSGLASGPARFYGHQLQKQSIKDVLDRRVEEFLAQEYEEKQRAQLDHLLKSMGSVAPVGHKVYLRKTSKGFRLDIKVVDPMGATIDT
jgi:hypothetical protein